MYGMYVSTVARDWSLKKNGNKTRQKFHVSGGLGINWLSNSRIGEWELHRQAWDPGMQITKTESLRLVCITRIDGLPGRAAFSLSTFHVDAEIKVISKFALLYFRS